MLGLLFGLVTAFAVGTLMTSAGNANAGGPGNKGFGTLEEPNGPASWLVNHYDNQSSRSPGRGQIVQRHSRIVSSRS